MINTVCLDQSNEMGFPFLYNPSNLDHLKHPKNLDPFYKKGSGFLRLLWKGKCHLVT